MVELLEPEYLGIATILEYFTVNLITKDSTEKLKMDEEVRFINKTALIYTEG